MYKIFVIGYGDMFFNVISGIKDYGNAEIIGALRHERILYNRFFLWLKDIFAPSKDLTFLKSHNLKDLPFQSINSEKLYKFLLKENIDYIFVCSWSEKLKKKIIDLPKIAAINVHPSLLPKYRGANPYFRVIMADEKQTGVSFHLINEYFDRGDIIGQEIVEIEEKETGQTLKKKCCETARKTVFKLLDNLDKDIIIPLKQDETKASYQPQIDENDILLNLKKTSIELDCQIRGLYPWHKTYICCNNKFFRVDDYEILSNNNPNLKAGTIFNKTSKGFQVLLKDNKIINFKKLSYFGMPFLTGWIIKFNIKNNI